MGVNKCAISARFIAIATQKRLATRAKATLAGVPPNRVQIPSFAASWSIVPPPRGPHALGVPTEEANACCTNTLQHAQAMYPTSYPWWQKQIAPPIKLNTPKHKQPYRHRYTDLDNPQPKEGIHKVQIQKDELHRVLDFV